MCIDQLKDTLEPISDFTKKRTAGGHFLGIPYLQQAVVDFDRAELTLAKTWSQTQEFFIAEDLQYRDKQESLSAVGIANSAVVNNNIEQINAAISAIVDKNEQLESALTDMATAMGPRKHGPR